MSTGARNAFYKSTAWKDCRKAYAKSKGNLCERCAEQGLIVPGFYVHHKKHLTDANLSDPTVALDWNNLQLLCVNCHAAVHKRGPEKRYKLDELGRVIFLEEDSTPLSQKNNPWPHGRRVDLRQKLSERDKKGKSPNY